MTTGWEGPRLRKNEAVARRKKSNVIFLRFVVHVIPITASNRTVNVGNEAVSFVLFGRPIVP